MATAMAIPANGRKKKQEKKPFGCCCIGGARHKLVALIKILFAGDLINIFRLPVRGDRWQLPPHHASFDGGERHSAWIPPVAIINAIALGRKVGRQDSKTPACPIVIWERMSVCFRRVGGWHHCLCAE